MIIIQQKRIMSKCKNKKRLFKNICRSIMSTLLPIQFTGSTLHELDNTSILIETSMLNISNDDMINSSHHGNENRLMDFWLDGVFKLSIGSLGIMMNTVGIWILCTQPRMQSMFLHILTCSLACDNGYMAMEMLSTLYHEFKISFLVWILPHFVYPFKEIFYTCNILVTIGLSYERYALISDKNGYKQTMEVARFRHQRLRKYLFAIALFSTIYNLPSFFTHYINLDEHEINRTEAYSTNKKIWKIIDKAIKWSIFLVGSFGLMVFYNWKVFRNIKTKLQIRHDIKSLNSTGTKESEYVPKPVVPKKTIRAKFDKLRTLRRKEKYTTALFALVSAFFLCNIWFFVEVILDAVKSLIKSDSFFIFLDNYEIISRVMRMLNSCTSIFIYCVVDRTFRQFFKSYLKRVANLLTCTMLKSLRKVDKVRESTIKDISQSVELVSRPISSRRGTLNEPYT